MRTNTAVTLYRKSVVNRAESWSRTVIDAVFWDAKKAANVHRSGLLAADSVALYIPFNELGIAPSVGDIIVRGEVTTDISSTFTAKTLKEDYDAFVVKSVDRKDYGSASMHHWQVGGS